MITHTILNVVIDNKIQFFSGKTIMTRQQAIDLIDDRLGLTCIDGIAPRGTTRQGRACARKSAINA